MRKGRTGGKRCTALGPFPKDRLQIHPGQAVPSLTSLILRFRNLRKRPRLPDGEGARETGTASSGGERMRPPPRWQNGECAGGSSLALCASLGWEAPEAEKQPPLKSEEYACIGYAAYDAPATV